MSTEMGKREAVMGLSGWLGRQEATAVERYLTALQRASEAPAGAAREDQPDAEVDEPSAYARVASVWKLAVGACSALGVDDPRIIHAVAEVMAAPMRGSTAVALPELSARIGAEYLPGAEWRLIEEGALLGLLTASGMVDLSTTEGSSPLLVLHGKLVSRRAYDAHDKVCKRWRPGPPVAFVPKSAVDASDAQSRSQTEAVLKVAAGHRNIILTGGPGTGKTTTIGRIVNLCVQAGKRVALAAPTGRAQARMFQSLLEQANAAPTAGAKSAAFKGTRSEEVSEKFREALRSGTVKPTTIHRLLGIHGGATGSRGRDKLIAADVVIVDEASMVDLTLMATLLEALPEHAQLVLVGDPNQLASVEAGSVLGDLIRAESGAAVDATQTIQLDVVHRTEEGSRIRDLAGVALGTLPASHESRASAKLAEALSERKGAFVVERKFTELKADDWTVLAEDFVALRGAVAALGSALDPAAFDAAVSRLLREELNRARVLCLHRGGKFGSVEANARIGAVVGGRSWSPTHPVPGQPVMATQNNNLLGIFNGDLGLCVERDGAPVFAFERPVSEDGSDAGVNYVSPAQVPGWEPAFATTVHKAQGSQADAVVVMLPDVRSRLCTREGLYTGITRAKERVIVVGPREVFDCCVARPTVRTSLLPELLAATP